MQTESMEWNEGACAFDTHITPHPTDVHDATDGIVVHVTTGPNGDGDVIVWGCRVRWATGVVREYTRMDRSVIEQENDRWVDDLDVVTPACFINKYLTTRCYGGPEEGGWYYDWDELVSSEWCPAEMIEERLVAAQLACAEENADEPELWSVLSHGRVFAVAEAWAEPLPARRPHYC
jgi:hypothetical protein